MKKTKQETKESSVAIAFAELSRLERDRAEFAAAKQTLRVALRRQALDLASLRERFEAERPRAKTRARRERARRERARDRLTARLVAEVQVAHEERLELIRAELEAKRLRLAAVQAAEAVPSNSRRALEWSVPVAAAMLVAFLGFTVFDDEAVAQTAPVATLDMAPAPAQVAEVAPEPAPEPVATPAPEPELIVVPAPEPEPKPAKKTTSKKSTTNKKSTASKSTTSKKPEPAPVIKKNSKPLELGDFDGNPLG